MGIALPAVAMAQDGRGHGGHEGPRGERPQFHNTQPHNDGRPNFNPGDRGGRGDMRPDRPQAPPKPERPQGFAGRDPGGRPDFRPNDRGRFDNGQPGRPQGFAGDQPRTDWQRRDVPGADRRWDGNRPDQRRWSGGRPDDRRWDGPRPGGPQFADGRRYDSRGGGFRAPDRWVGSNWRGDGRYDWRGWRASNRGVYHLGRYVPPRDWGYGYRRFSIGYTVPAFFWGADYWIDDPWDYRLPPAYGPYRWVRYYDDVLLIDLRSGRVVDMIPDFFW